MKHDNEIDWPKLLGYPVMYDDISFDGFIFERLDEKICPIHKSPMYCYHRLRLHDDYVRDRYRCSEESCLCRADFVGDELKSDKVSDTAWYVWGIVKERHFSKENGSTVATDTEELFIPFVPKS